MTKAKIAISLPKEQLARAHREVRAGRAGSVSGYIAHVLAAHEKRESLRGLLRDLIAQHGNRPPRTSNGQNAHWHRTRDSAGYRRADRLGSR